MNVENENIRKLRNMRSLTQEEFAEKAGFSVDTLRKCERGSNLTLKTAIAVANAYDVSLDWIYGRTEDTADTASTMLLYLKKLFNYHIDENYVYPYIFEINPAVLKFLDEYKQATDLLENGKIPEAAYVPWIEKIKADFNAAIKSKDINNYEYCLIPKNEAQRKDAPTVRIDLAATLGGNNG